MDTEKKSALSYLLLILAVVVLRAGLALFPVDHPQARQSLLQWKEILLLAAMVRMGMVSGAPWLAASSAKIFLASLVPLSLFCRSRFLALVGFRFATSMLWHVLWPAVCF